MLALVLVLVLVVFSGSFGCKKRMPAVSENGVRELRIDATPEHWRTQGFFELTPPLRLPSNRAGTDESRIWIHIPEGAFIKSIPLDAGAHPPLVFPPGTELDRVESITSHEGATDGVVADVRGTVVSSNGAQSFHMYRPLDGALRGFEWRSDRPAAQQEVESRLIELATGDARERRRFAERLRALARCASCHPAAKPENIVAFQDGLNNRATDANGFYVPQSIFEDELPVETYRPREMNANDPFVRFSCRSGTLESRGVISEVRFACSDGSPVRGRLDLRAALEARDPHALAVCASRCFLFRRMHASTRALFGDALTACRPGCKDIE